MKCRPRARCNIRRPFQTRCHRSRHQHSRQQTHFRQRYHETVSRGAASAWMISASSFASNLIDNTSVVSKDSPGALHNKLGALTFSASPREPSQPVPATSHQETQCQGPRRLSPGRRPEIVMRGPTAVSTMIAGFKEPTENVHASIPSNNFGVVCHRMRLYRFPRSGWLESHGHRAPCRNSAETKRSVHRTFGLASQDILLREGQKTTPNSHMRHKQACELNSGSPSCGTSMLPTLQ